MSRRRSPRVPDQPVVPPEAASPAASPSNPAAVGALDSSKPQRSQQQQQQQQKQHQSHPGLLPDGDGDHVDSEARAKLVQQPVLPSGKCVSCNIYYSSFGQLDKCSVCFVRDHGTEYPDHPLMHPSPLPELPRDWDPADLDEIFHARFPEVRILPPRRVNFLIRAYRDRPFSELLECVCAKREFPTFFVLRAADADRLLDALAPRRDFRFLHVIVPRVLDLWNLQSGKNSFVDCHWLNDGKLNKPPRKLEELSGFWHHVGTEDFWGF